MTRDAEMAMAWEPLPPRANHYMQVGVVRLVEEDDQDGFSLSIILEATFRPADAQAEETASWRVIFYKVFAYRMRPLAAWWPEALPLTLPPPTRKSNARLDVATWEIAHSHWLRECVPPADRSAAHHYVVADFDQVYEIAAGWWVMEQAPSAGT